MKNRIDLTDYLVCAKCGRPITFAQMGYDGRGACCREPSVPQSLDAPLPYPHYTEERWNREQLIWGKVEKATHVNYSDRLWEWDREAAQRAGKAVPTAYQTARSIQQWLSVYYGKPVTLKYVYAGCNASSGYPYWAYGYDLVD